MVHRIHLDPHVTVFPSVEVINDQTLAVRENMNVDSRGIYRWKDLTFQWEGIPVMESHRRKNKADPIRSENEITNTVSANFNGQVRLQYYCIKKINRYRII